MRIHELLSVFAVIEGKKDKPVKIRTPQIRAARNQRFLSQWFDANCQISEDGIRPNRCANWKKRFFAQWDRMNAAFEKECGYFNPDIPNGGPPPADAQSRRRRADDITSGESAGKSADKEDYYSEEDYAEPMLEIDFSFSDSDLDGLENDGYSDDYPHYSAIFAEEDDFYLDPDLPVSSSSTDEDNGPLRKESDLYEKEARQMSNNPARALRQLTNAMKQYCKRYISDCGFEKNKNGHSQRIRSHYKKLAILHTFVIETQAAKSKRLYQRQLNKESRL
jgi:hypothetical protein